MNKEYQDLEEQAIKADCYDMIAEALREAGLLSPGGSVVTVVNSLIDERWQY